MVRFDDLPDLALIEIFSYLSSVNVLWSFNGLNDRLAALIAERGFFRQVNLSCARRRQFDILIRVLPLNKIECLTIDIDASPLQLRHWPYLPRLTRLRLNGIYNFDDVSIFVILHAATLTHLSLEPMKHYVKNRLVVTFPYPTCNITALVENVLLRHLSALQWLDIGANRQFSMRYWHIVSVPMSLTYLRLTLSNVNHVLLVMSTRPLPDILRELHVTMEDYGDYDDEILENIVRSPPMIRLHIFTLVKPFFSTLPINWTIVKSITHPSVMPVLRRIKLAIVILIKNFDHFCHWLLSVDYRRINLQFALSLIDWGEEIKPDEIVMPTSRFYPRQIVGVTLTVKKTFPLKKDTLININYYNKRTRRHLWYTLPWSFNDFFQDYIPMESIIEVEVFEMCSMKVRIGSSRLRTLVISDDVLPPSILDLPHVTPLDRIEILEFSYCDRSIDVKLPALHHVTLINTFNFLKRFSSLPASVRSIDILLYCSCPDFIAPNWNEFRSIVSFSLVKSLRIVLYNMQVAIDQNSCQIIAQTVTKLRSFAICFRMGLQIRDLDIKSMLNNQRTFINELRHCIILLSIDQHPFHVVERGGCGLTVWFD